MMTRRARQLPRNALVSLLAILIVTLSAGCREQDSVVEIRALQAKGSFEESLEPLRRMLAERPDDPELSYLYGVALLKTGSPDMAIWAIRKAAESEDWARPAALALGNAAFAAQEWKNAIEIADEILASDPNDVEALAIRANARIEQKSDYPAALEDFERLIELNPQDLTTQSARVAVLIALGRSDEAADGIAALEKAAEGDVATDAFRARVCTIRALYTGERGLHEEAAAIFSSCLERFPRNSTLVNEYVGYLDDQRQPEKANETLRNALSLSPNDSVLRLTLSRRLISMRRFDESETILREGTVLSRRRAASDSWAGLADHYVALKDYGAAADAFEKSLSLLGEPSVKQTLQLADILAQAGRNEQALEVAKRLESDAFRGLIEARVSMNQGDPAAALARLDSVLPAWPNNPGARYWAARAAEQTGQFGRAVEEYRQSIRSDPGFSDAALRLALLHEAEGAAQDAWSAINRYVNENPDDDEAAAVTMRLASRYGPDARVRAIIKNFRSRPSWPAALAERADFVADSVSPAQAVEAIRELGTPDLRRPRNASVLRSLTVHLSELERGDEALQAVELALAAAPEDSRFLEIQGEILARKGELAAARSSFERAVQADPRNARALVGLGRIVADAGDLDAALELFSRAATTDESLMSAYLEAATRLAQAGRTPEAEERWTALLRERPYHTDAAMALVRGRLQRDDSSDETLGLARRAVRFRGGSDAMRLLAEVHEARGESAEAKAVLDRIVQTAEAS